MVTVAANVKQLQVSVVTDPNPSAPEALRPGESDGAPKLQHRDNIKLVMDDKV